MTELEVFVEHWDRYRSVTLQILDVLADEDLAWRPHPEAFSCWQQLLHIARTEEYVVRGVTEGEWEKGPLRFPAEPPTRVELAACFAAAHDRTREYLGGLGPGDLDRPVPMPGGRAEQPLRWWLWFVLEHEVHHKAQLSVYLRQMGRVPPYFAVPYPAGVRPDIRAREELGEA